MNKLAIDIETFSGANLKTEGLYKYIAHHLFEIIIFAYKWNDDPVVVIDLAAGEQIPDWVVKAILDKTIKKTAYNAMFERLCIGAYLGMTLDPNQWYCTMIKGAMCGLPMGLDKAAEALKLEDKKVIEGKVLLRFFCIPCKPTDANGHRTRNMWYHDMERWERFKQYGGQDVVVESKIYDKLEFFEIPPTERRLWALDQKINDHGFKIDRPFVLNAIEQNQIFTDKLKAEVIEITGIKNAKSVKQIKDWLSLEINELVPTLKKDALPELLKTVSNPVARRVIELRQMTSKSSIDKYKSMRDMCMEDDYIRGLFKFGGASRTFRWSGSGVQPHNLIKNDLVDLDLARRLVASNDLDLAQILYGNVTKILSQLIRTAFVPPSGYKFWISDFSQIEARIIAWLAGEKWRLDIFKTHGKIYEASASAMFKIPIEWVTKTSSYRAKGKIAELALGYQGSVGALVRMGALEMGLLLEELQDLVTLWRIANPHIVDLWYDINEIALQVVRTKGSATYKNLRFHMEKGILFITLPSGRKLSYLRAGLKMNKFGTGECITYWGVDQKTKQWVIGETYGGKLVENITQAIARDLLGEAMIRLDDADFIICGHVHDEVICEVPLAMQGIERMTDIMSMVPAWAEGCPLGAASFESDYYKKD